MPTLEEVLAGDQAQLVNLIATDNALRSQVDQLTAQLSEAQANLSAGEQLEAALQASIQTLTDRIGVLNGMQVPSSSGPYAIRNDDDGLRVWALQRALNEVGFSLLEDGAFRSYTYDAVKDWQVSRGLFADGVFGPTSSAAMAKQLDGLHDDLPTGLIRGFTEAEGGNWIAAVNWTVAGGVDCGYIQRRVYDADLNDQTVIRRAFDSAYQIGLLASQLRERKNTYRTAPAVSTDEFAWRLAALHHNWPYGASVLSKTQIADLSSYWTTVKPADQWPTNIGARFPNGELVDTPLKWAKFYALGAPNRNWPGSTTKYVTSWPA